MASIKCPFSSPLPLSACPGPGVLIAHCGRLTRIKETSKSIMLHVKSFPKKISLSARPSRSSEARSEESFTSKHYSFEKIAHVTVIFPAKLSRISIIKMVDSSLNFPLNVFST